MPLLGHDDALPAAPHRILVNGTSGAGKTTLARRISQAAGTPHVELDALHHGPGWVPRPEFLDDVEALASLPQWVTEWQYSAARPTMLARCDLVVWLDLPDLLAFGRLVRRTVRRRLRREVLWNGNVEPPLHRVLADPDHVIRFGWRTRRRAAARADWALRERPDLPVVRLRTQTEVDGWVSGPLRAG